MQNSDNPIKNVRKLYYLEFMEVVFELGANTFEDYDDAIGVFETEGKLTTYLSVETY